MLEEMNKELKDISLVSDINMLENSLQLRLGDKKVKLIGNFTNIQRIQQATGRGEIANIVHIGKAEFSIVDVATVIFNGMDEKDQRIYDLETVGNIIIKSKKYGEYVAAAVGFLGLILEDGEELGKSVEETAGK